MIDLTAAVDNYLAGLPIERRAPVSHLREAIANNLPDGFVEICAGKPQYVVPPPRLPATFQAVEPLPFMGFANRKSYVALYHFALPVDMSLQDWFQQEYAHCSKTALDMGKRCIRFRKPAQIPFELVAELARQRSVDDWLALYTSHLRSRPRPEAKSAARAQG